jgi:hypothetical protein
MDPPTADEIAAIEARCNAHVARFGKDIQNDYGWASEVIGKRRRSDLTTGGQGSNGLPNTPMAGTARLGACWPRPRRFRLCSRSGRAIPVWWTRCT